MAAKNRNAGPVTQLFKSAPMSTKMLLFIVLLGGGGTTVLTMLGINQVAPDPEVVKETAADVSAIKTSLSTLELSIRHMVDNNGRDKAEYERRFADTQRAIDRLEVLADKARKIDEHERRITALEGRK